ncbi:MAG: ribose 5-phosphate isomerase B [Clostridia bacterium]|nr:ribose 5-phosphate isomerase B [Clostridia bacterium]
MIAIASDHAGYELKEKLKKHLEEKGFEYRDFGTYSTESCDYPVFAKKACNAVISGECEKAVLVCGTGIGVSMAANKIKGIRAAVCSDTYSAKYTRLHNNANALCMGARVIGEGLAAEITDIFLTTPFEGGKHQRRIDMFE